MFDLIKVEDVPNLAELGPEKDVLLRRRHTLLKGWQRFADLVCVYSETTPLCPVEIENFGVAARQFVVKLQRDVPKRSVTPKLHYLGNHYVEFMRLYRGMGRFAEQGLERMHQVASLRGFKGAEQLKRSSEKHMWTRGAREFYPGAKRRLAE